MRRAATWLLVLALGGLGFVAGVDAFRDDGGSRPEERRAASTESGSERGPAWAAAVAGLRSAGLRGVLSYLDDECRLRSLSLPDLESHPAEGEWCSLGFTAANEMYLGADALGPGLQVAARCRGGFVEVRHPPGGDLVARARGCAPAWTPHGTPTFARGGEVFVFESCSGEETRLPVRCAARLLSREEIERAFRFDANIPDGPGAVASVRIVSLEWLTETRLAALLVVHVRHGPIEPLLAFYEGGRAIGGVPGLGSGFTGLRVSPSRDALAVAGPGGLRLLRSDGRSLPVPRALLGTFGRAAFEPRAVAWSPDETWLAVVARASIYVVPVEEGRTGLIRIPVAARDVVWR